MKSMLYSLPQLALQRRPCVAKRTFPVLLRICLHDPGPHPRADGISLTPPSFALVKGSEM